MNNSTLKNILIVFFVLLVPFMAILGAFRLTVFNMYVYEEQFNKYEPVAAEDPVIAAANTLTFLKDKDAGLDYISIYTQEEQVHLVEVRDVIHKALLVLYTSIVAAVLIIILLFFADKKNIILNSSLALFYGGGFSAVFILLSFGLVFLRFESAFAYFHKLFFATAWQFPPDHLLIKLFPQMFFVSILIKIIFIAFVISIFFNVIGYYLTKKEKYLMQKKTKKLK